MSDTTIAERIADKLFGTARSDDWQLALPFIEKEVASLRRVLANATGQRDDAANQRDHYRRAVRRALELSDGLDDAGSRKAIRDILRSAVAGEEVDPTTARPWHRVDKSPPPDGQRVECFAWGWSSLAHGIVSPATRNWVTWFGSELTGIVPDLWRVLPDEPLIGDVLADSDPWTYVTEDDTSLPPVGEEVIVWGMGWPPRHGLAKWCVYGSPEGPWGQWESENWKVDLSRRCVTAWRRVDPPKGAK